VQPAEPPSAQAQTFQVPAAAALARIQRKGVLKIQISLAASASLPNGTSLLVNASTGVVDASYTNSASIDGHTTIASRKAAITLLVPYTWIVASAADKVNVTGYVDLTATDITYLTRTIALPANGATTVLSFQSSI
jgi:hypothetical protein